MTEQDPRAEVEDALYQAAISGNVAAIAAYLRRRGSVSVEDRIALLLDGPPKLTAAQVLAEIRQRLKQPTLNDHPGIAKREQAKVLAILDEVEGLL